MTNSDESMAHATNTLAQLRKADRDNVDEAIHDQHATILEALAEQIADARAELDDPYDALLADIEAALRVGAHAARRGAIGDEDDLRAAMLLGDDSDSGEDDE
jgi:hypothetical protein